MLMCFQVDDREAHGEVPGTAAYKMREKDAVPDEVKIMSKVPRHKSTASNSTTQGRPQVIPKTVVEKIEPSSPSHGEVPGTPAHAKRMSDAVPDLVRPVGSSSGEERSPSNTDPTAPVPTTVVTKVDSIPSYGEVPGTEAYDKRRGDAEPDIATPRWTA